MGGFRAERRARFPGRKVLVALSRSASRHLRRLAAAVQAVLDSAAWLIEDCAAVCAADALVSVLVLLALLSFEALSLLYISAAAVGMFNRHSRAHTLPSTALPALLAIALLQYAVFTYTSRNPPEESVGGRSADSDAAVWHWLGLNPTATQLVVLFTSAGIAAAARSVAAWRSVAGPTPSRAPPTPRLTTPRSTGDSLNEDTDVTPQNPPADGPQPHRGGPLAQHDLYYELVRASVSARHRPVPLLAHSPMPRLVVVADWGRGRPPALGGRAAWGWPEWFRFWLFRLSLDVLMVVVVALCAVQRDLIHAAYLALTLWLFRHREALRLQGNRLFFWLPLANLAVIVLMLLFQAPWQRLAQWVAGPDVRITGLLATPDSSSNCADSQDGGWCFGGVCSVASLLGLHRIMHAGEWRALELSPNGLGTPLLMWVAIQVHRSWLPIGGLLHGGASPWEGPWAPHPAPEAPCGRSHHLWTCVLTPLSPTHSHVQVVPSVCPTHGGGVPAGAVAAPGRAGLSRYRGATPGGPGAAAQPRPRPRRRPPPGQHAALPRALGFPHAPPRPPRPPQAHTQPLSRLRRRRPPHASGAGLCVAGPRPCFLRPLRRPLRRGRPSLRRWKEQRVAGQHRRAVRGVGAARVGVRC